MFYKSLLVITPRREKGNEEMKKLNYKYKKIIMYKIKKLKNEIKSKEKHREKKMNSINLREAFDLY